MVDGLVVRGRVWMRHLVIIGIFLRIRMLTLLRVAMLWDGTCRVDRRMNDLADFEIRFVIGKEPLPMLKTLSKAQDADR